MKLIVGLFACVLASSSVLGSTLEVACGPKAYDALQDQDPSLAELHALFTLRGRNKVPEKFKIESVKLGTWTEKNSKIPKWSKLFLLNGGWSLTETKSLIEVGRKNSVIGFKMGSCAELDYSSGRAYLWQDMDKGFPSSTLLDCVCRIVK